MDRILTDIEKKILRAKWYGMKSRCYCKKSQSYKNYGKKILQYVMNG